MRMETLELFISIVDLGSISQAARKHHLSQPAVTSQIKALEEEQSVTLFVRNPGQRKPIVLTEAGEVFYDYSIKLLNMYQEMTISLKSLDTAYNSFVLGVGPTAGTYTVPFILESLSRRYPQIHINMKMCLAANLLPNLQKREYDMIIMVSPPKSPDLVSKIFYSDEIVLIASENYKIKDSITLGQLKKLPIALREESSTSFRILENNLNKYGTQIKDLNVVMQTFGTEAIKQAVSTGMALGFVAKSSITGHNASNMLKTIEIKGLKLVRNIHLVYHTSHPFTPSMKFFWDFVSSYQWQ